MKQRVLVEGVVLDQSTKMSSTSCAMCHNDVHWKQVWVAIARNGDVLRLCRSCWIRREIVQLLGQLE